MSHPILSLDLAEDKILPDDNYDREDEPIIEHAMEETLKISKVYTPHTSGLKNWWVRVMQPLTFIDWK